MGFRSDRFYYFLEISGQYLWVSFSLSGNIFTSKIDDTHLIGRFRRPNKRVNVKAQQRPWHGLSTQQIPDIITINLLQPEACLIIPDLGCHMPFSNRPARLALAPSPLLPPSPPHRPSPLPLPLPHGSPFPPHLPSFSLITALLGYNPCILKVTLVKCII